LNNLGYDSDDFEEDSEDESLNDSAAPVEIIKQVQQSASDLWSKWFENAEIFVVMLPKKFKKTKI
jgi:hypothetical protein